LTPIAASKRIQLLVLIVAVVLALWSLISVVYIGRTHVPQELPYVEVVTTRCLGRDGQPVGDEYGQPCPSGTTPDTVVIQSLLPTAQP
jgi:hypothetical protein